MYSDIHSSVRDGSRACGKDGLAEKELQGVDNFLHLRRLDDGRAKHIETAGGQNASYGWLARLQPSSAGGDDVFNPHILRREAPVKNSLLSCIRDDSRNLFIPLLPHNP